MIETVPVDVVADVRLGSASTVNVSTPSVMDSSNVSMLIVWTAGLLGPNVMVVD